MPRKKTRNKPLLSNAKPRSNNKRTKSTTEKSIESLQSELFERVQSCLKSFGVDTSNLSNEMINVEPNKTYGNVQCILCSQDLKIKPKPKRVYYHSGLKSSYWVVENLKKHIHNVHRCDTTVSPQNRMPKKSPKNIRPPKKTKLPKIKQESVQHHSTPKQLSIVQINSDLDDSDVALNIIQSRLTSDASEPFAVDDDDFYDDFDADLSTNNNNPCSYLEQFSYQTTKMVEAVLMNGDTQSSMNFQMKNDKVRQLSVVEVEKDGNCMFSSCAHQLFRKEIHSVEHTRKIAQLREKVVAHILDPNHFSTYQFVLQDRVYEMKKKSEISDLKEECVSYVRDILSQPSVWGGMETLKAVSNLYKTNVAVINENGPAYIIKNAENKFNRTIIIAYRYWKSNVLMHYDSISDINADDIFELVKSL